jgi:hypothetical protein
MIFSYHFGQTFSKERRHDNLEVVMVVSVDAWQRRTLKDGAAGCSMSTRK